MPNLVTLMRHYALENYYHHSWDMVTNWTTAELDAAIGGAKTRRGAIANVWGILQHIDAKRPRWNRPARPQSLLEFLVRGGLRPCADLAYILDGNPLIRGRKLLRETGMTLDRAHEAAVEAGYLHCEGWNTDREASSTTNDLLDAIAAEAAGTKLYAMGEEPVVPLNYEAPDLESEDVCPF